MQMARVRFPDDADVKDESFECFGQTHIMRAEFRDSIVVSISACHADDPGSIPGRGVASLCS